MKYCWCNFMYKRRYPIFKGSLDVSKRISVYGVNVSLADIW